MREKGAGGGGGKGNGGGGDGGGGEVAEVTVWWKGSAGKAVAVAVVRVAGKSMKSDSGRKGDLKGMGGGGGGGGGSLRKPYVWRWQRGGSGGK